MNKMIELRQKRDGVLTEAEALVEAAEAEDRGLNEEEQTQYDNFINEANELRGRIERLEGLKNQRGNAGKAPAHLKIKRGDNEVRALAHFVRTGDSSGVSHLTSGGEGGDARGTTAITLRLPSIQEQRAAVDSTMNITTAADGGNLVPTGFVPDVVTRMNESMLANRLGCRVIPGKGTTVNYPVEAADPEEFPTTSEQNDGHTNNYERDAGNTDLKPFTLVKKTRKVELTEEMLEDNDVDLMSYIGNRIGRQISATHNNMLITEAGTNGTNLDTFNGTAAIAAGEPENIVFHDTLGYYLEDDSNIAWVMRPTTYGAIASITGNGRLYAEGGGSRSARDILGYPAYYSNKVAAMAASTKSVYFGNWDYMGYRMAPELRIIQDPYSVDGLLVLKYSFRAVYGVLQAGAIGYGTQAAS